MDTKVYTLPGGLVDEAGRIHRTVELSQLTGRVQAEITNATKGNKGITVAADVLYGRCVQRLGDVNLPELRKDPDALGATWSSLFAGDRDYMMFHAVRPLGDKVPGYVKCPYCKKGAPVPPVSLKSFTKYVLKAHYDKSLETADAVCPVVEIEDVEKSKAAKEDTAFIFRVKNDDYGVSAVFRLPTGFDQETYTPIAQKDPADTAHVMLSLTCREWKGKAGEVDADVFRDLPSYVLEFLLDEFRQHTPGIEPTDLDFSCPSPDCGEVTPMQLQHFFSAASRARKSSTARSR